MIPERFIMEDLKKLATYILLALTFSVLFYGYLNLIYDPVKDCAWTIQTLSPEKQSRLVENRRNFSAPHFKYVENWCSANLENWYSEFKKAKEVR
jgi:hypothetical protein